VWSSSNVSVLALICEAIRAGAIYGPYVEARLGRSMSPTELDHVRLAAEHVAQVVAVEREEHGLD
jgi:hypothetical protein